MMQIVIPFTCKTLLLIYCNVIINGEVGVDAILSTDTKENICNYQEPVCPLNKCCSDLICKQEESSYRCCDIPIDFNRETFSDYVITKQGWGCSNCPKCGKMFISRTS